MKINILLLLCTAFLHRISTSCCDHNHENTKKENNATNSTNLNLLTFGTKFLNSLKKQFPDTYKSIIVNLTELEQQVIESQGIENNNPVFPHPEDYNDYINSNEVNNTTIDNSITAYEDEDFIGEIKKYVTRAGKRKLKHLGYIVKKHLNSTLNIKPLLYNIKKIYTGEMEKYFNFICEKKVVNEIEREFVILDIIASSNQIFCKISNLLYLNIASKSRVALTQAIVKTVLKITRKAVHDNKKADLKYICKSKYVCRHFPAYSDHVAQLLKNILILPDDKFMITVKMLQEIVGMHVELLKTFIDDDVTYNISTELKSLVDSLSEISEFLSVVTGIITHRYKMFYSVDIEIKNSTKAVRILIDIIDKTFEILDDKFIYNDFDNVLKGMNDWVKGKRDSIYVLCNDFCDKAFNVLKHHWNRDTREEVKVLIEVIIKGASKNNIWSDYLFVEGSDFVKGDAAIFSDDDKYI